MQTLPDTLPEFSAPPPSITKKQKLVLLELAFSDEPLEVDEVVRRIAQRSSAEIKGYDSTPVPAQASARGSMNAMAKQSVPLVRRVRLQGQWQGRTVNHYAATDAGRALITADRERAAAAQTKSRLRLHTSFRA